MESDLLLANYFLGILVVWMVAIAMIVILSNSGISCDDLRSDLLTQVRSSKVDTKWAQIISRGATLEDTSSVLFNSLKIPAEDLQFPSDVKNIAITLNVADSNYDFYILRNDGTKFHGIHPLSPLPAEARRHELSTQLAFMLTTDTPPTVYLKVKNTKYMSQDEVLFVMARITQDAFKQYRIETTRLTRESEVLASWGT